MVLLTLIGFGLHPSRIVLLFSGEVPPVRIAAMAGIIVFLGYVGAALLDLDRLRDARKSRRR
jgi:hypothetical protein